MGVNGKGVHAPFLIPLTAYFPRLPAASSLFEPQLYLLIDINWYVPCSLVTLAVHKRYVALCPEHPPCLRSSSRAPFSVSPSIYSKEVFLSQTIQPTHI